MTHATMGLVVLAALAGALAACSSAAPTPLESGALSAPPDAGPPPAPAPPACTPGGDGTYTTALYDDLDRYCMVEIRDGEISPRSSAILP